MRFKQRNRDAYETMENGKRVPKLKNCWKNPYSKYPMPDYAQECKSDSKEDIIDYIVRTHLVEWYVTKLLRINENEELAKEYIQEIYLYICQTEEEKWKCLYNQGLAAITAFVSGLVIRNCISSTSRPFVKFRRHYKHYIPLNDSEWMVYEDTEKLPNWLNNNDEENIE